MTCGRWNPGPNGRVDAIAMAGGTVYLGGDFTRLGAVARTRLAAVDAATGALLPWAPSADQDVSSMVFHPGTGHLIVAGHFTTLNGTTQLGMGSLDGVTGAVQPWPVNTIIKNYDETAAINSLATDGTKVYGVGWGFLGGGGNGNFEGVFAADAATGALDWVDGGRGDNYDIALAGNVLYTVGHPHDWGMLDWNPQTNPCDLAARDGDRQAPVADADERVRDAEHLAGVQRPARGAAAALAPVPDGRDVHGARASRVERRHERHVHRARR